MKSEVTALWGYANEIIVELENWIKRNDKKHIHLTVSRENQIRLLRLRTWQFRYKISIEEILDLTVPVLRFRTNVHKVRKRSTWAGLGVTIRALVGPGSELILAQDLEKRYPGNEHILRWKEQTRERQLEAEQQQGLDGLESTANKPLTLMGCDSVEQYLNRYKKRTAHRRRIHEVEVTKKSRRRKPYRGNPWR